MIKEKYPKWIDEFARAIHKGLSNMMPCSWGPIDNYETLSFLNGTFISQIYKAIKNIKEKGCSKERISKCFPSISSLRVAMYWLMLEYQTSKVKNKKEFREIMDFFINLLEYITKEDTFAYKSNIIHSQKEINNILNKTPLEKANPEIARNLGKLYTGLASLVFALYRDFYPQDSHEIYGPYEINDNSILIIKHFPKIKPLDLWPQVKGLKYSDVKIFQIFKNIKFKCEIIGMHSIYDGNLINNLVSYAVMIDGKYTNNIEEIKELSNYFAEVATKYSTICDGLSKEELKKKILEWECYQFVDFFKLAEMNWKPTKEMLEAVKDKKVGDRYELEEFPSFEEYVKSPEFEIYWLKDLYN